MTGRGWCLLGALVVMLTLCVVRVGEGHLVPVLAEVRTGRYHHDILASWTQDGTGAVLHVRGKTGGSSGSSPPGSPEASGSSGLSEPPESSEPPGSEADDSDKEHAEEVQKHYKASLERGEKLFKLLDAPNAPLSAFQDYSDLNQYGWNFVRETKMRISPKIRPALRDLKISEKAEDWANMVWQHSEDSKDPGTGMKYPATDVKYELAVSPAGGIVVLFNIFSPALVWAKGAKDIVPLHRFSDIVWLIWAQECHDAKIDPGSLRYVLHVNVNNAQTLDTIEAVTRVEPFSLPGYPGHSFAADTEAVKAFVGTPNGLGTAYLVINHRKQFGPRVRLQSVRVWGGSRTSASNTHLLFTLGGDESSQAPSAGTKRPADDSGDEGNRPPPSQRPQNERRSKAKGRATELKGASKPDRHAQDVVPRAVSDTGRSENVRDGEIQPYERPSADNIQDAYIASAARGGRLFEQFDKPDTAASKWENYGDLARNGWKLVAEPRIKIGPKWTAMLDDLKISKDPEQWHSMIWQHSQGSGDPFVAGGIYPATSAEYKFAVNPSAGIIVVFSVKGPADLGAHDLVPLYKFSDVAWLAWVKHCHDAKADPAKLRYILYPTTINPQTLTTVEAVTHTAPEKMPKYPGELFAGSGKDALQALVGTTNGLDAGNLLVEHKKQLGLRRRVQSVRVWGPSSANRPAVEILFTLDEYKGAVTGDKRPADDSDDEGGNVRPPPGRMSSGSRRSRVKGRRAEDHDVSEKDGGLNHRDRRRSGSGKSGQPGISLSQSSLAPPSNSFNTPSGSSRSGYSTPGDPFAGGSSGGGSSGTGS